LVAAGDAAFPVRGEGVAVAACRVGAQQLDGVASAGLWVGLLRG
jgi:hypothetical protein